MVGALKTTVRALNPVVLLLLSVMFALIAAKCDPVCLNSPDGKCQGNTGPDTTAFYYNVGIVGGASTMSTAAFDPDPYTTTVGAAATRWLNYDDLTHRLVSDAPLFDTGDIPHSGSAGFRFTRPGSVKYHCMHHPTMTGTIIVNP